MASNTPHNEHEEIEDDEVINEEEVSEVIEDDDQDVPMDDDEDQNEFLEEIAIQNDSIAHFDAHTDSIFCIAHHPLNPMIIATGGGDDIGYIYDTSSATDSRPVLPSSYNSGPAQNAERQSLMPLQKLDGHTDSVNAICFTTSGQFLVTAGLDGKLRVWRTRRKDGAGDWTFLAEAKEVEEINWLSPCPSTTHADAFALGANDGSVWVYTINPDDKGNELSILMTQYLHTESSTAGAWTPDGNLLATVAEDSSLYVWDVFGTASAVVSLTASDQRFAVEGGLYAVACSNSMAAVGGAEGNIRVIGLPTPGQATSGKSSKNKQASTSAAGQILASLQAQSDGVETLSFSSAPLNLLASGSVDGSIALFDTAHRFAVRRHIKEAHEDQAVVKVDFLRSQRTPYVLTSCGMDGVVRRWDVRGGTTAAGQGFTREWLGHRGGGEGGGVLGFVQSADGSRIVTAGDDGVSLVFEAQT